MEEIRANGRSREARPPISRGAVARTATLVFVVLSLVFLVLAPAQAHAGQIRQLEGEFGSVVEPSFVNPEGLAVDPTSGDLLVIDAGAGTISRWNPDGTPADFSALGINVIDGKGPGDATPQEELLFGPPGEVQVAVDSSGGPTDGNIYVTQAAAHLVDIFASSGEYVGQLTAADSTEFGEVCGVGVGADGSVFVGDFNGSDIHEFSPSTTVPSNSDFTADFELASVCTVAVGSGGSASGVFGAQLAGSVYRFDSDSRQRQYAVTDNVGTTISVAAATGHLLVAVGPEVIEFEAPGAGGASRISTLTAAGAVQGVAAAGFGDRLYLSREGSSNIDVFGPPLPVPTVAVSPVSDPIATKASLRGTVNPEGEALTECFFEYGPTNAYGEVAPCAEPDAAEVGSGANPVEVHADLAGLSPRATLHFRLRAANPNGVETSADEAFETTPDVFTHPATSISDVTATLNGSVRPEGSSLTACEFEYGSTTAYGSSVPCLPAAGAIPVDFEPHAVKADLQGLSRGATYHFLLVTEGPGGRSAGEDLSFVSHGDPRVLDQYASEVETERATLDARVDPSGFPASYRFEWGPTPAYGHLTPAVGELFLGPSGTPAVADAEIDGLSPATKYHFRVVVTTHCRSAEPQSACVVTGSDQTFGSLDAAGLPDGRAYELVSPADRGPLATTAENVVLTKLQFPYQVAGDGSAASFVLAPGASGTKSGGEVTYASHRTEGGWRSSELTPPVTGRVTSSGNYNAPSIYDYLSPDLGCGVVSTTLPLTADTPPRTVEEGGANIYRRNRAGEYTLITETVPSNVAEVRTGINAFFVVGASPDCGRIFFETAFQYEGAGLGGVGRELYEWDESGVPRLRHVGFVPGPSGEQAVPVGAGSGDASLGGEGRGARNFAEAVSADGSQVTFSGLRLMGGDPAEVGKVGVFVRKGGSTVDITRSETSTPDGGATYQVASTDGRRVFFIARYGLAANGSSQGAAGCLVGSAAVSASGEGCDLYEYDFAKPEGSRLIDLSVDEDSADEAGAGVAGIVAGSADGSHVYFAALGQLGTGGGRGYAENRAQGSYNVFLAHGGECSFVGTITARDAQHDLIEYSLGTTGIIGWVARASADGTHLAFESSLDLGGYEGGGVRQAYLYSAETHRTDCVSCLPGGGVPIGNGVAGALGPLATAQSQANYANPPRIISEHGDRLFFETRDRLAPGAITGNRNIYEWANGTIHTLASGEPATILEGGPVQYGAVEYVGSGRDGDDVFIAAPGGLTSQARDDRRALYDLRVGGGFPAEAGQPTPCDALTANGCAGAAPPPPTDPAVVTSNFSGAGNPKPGRPGCGKGRRAVTKDGKRRCVKRHQRKQRHGRAASHRRRHSRPKAKRHRHEASGPASKGVVK
jgi:hypothetical protein